VLAEPSAILTIEEMLPLNQGWGMLDGLHADAQRQRHRLQDWWKTHDEPGGEVVRPIIIAGSYRTGTTYLHRLLAAMMPERRTLLGWEANIPTPPPFPTMAARLNDPRCAEQREVMTSLYEVDPSLEQMHDEAADRPAECVRALAHTGLTGLWPAVAPCPDYVEWMFSHDAQVYSHAVYEYYDRCLRTQHPHHTPWLIKAPMHSLFVSAIMGRWPDAVFIMIDRPLVETVQSAMTYFNQLRKLSQPDSDHWSELAEWVPQYVEMHVQAMSSVAGKVEIIPVRSASLRQDPYRTARQIITKIRQPEEPF
jgi:hypothetical protein